MSAFFEVSSLGVRIGDTTIVKDINLDFREGEVTALLGHNGSGKSTLLKVLARQLAPAKGDVRLLGNCKHRTDAREFARTVGYLPQHPPGTDGLTVRELVALGRYPWRGPLGRYTSDDYELIDQAIADTGLTPFRHRSVDTLSGGERQRAWIAMLLAQQTRCLLLDEPISALDVKHQVETLRLVHRLAEERDLTVVVVLHDVDLAARFCDRLVALRGGQLIADGTPQEIMNSGTLETIYGVPMGVMERAPGQWVSYVH
ncbi:ATP-binding cassette domain-containing protein [Marinobacter sp.]|uniref:ABC transporter ATP-binding protein n=1 Tax=Marinobacter sp. TaxID=50741 RepID=UPI0023561636|nr:ATP-binding cassette domain-containing protein [Marinobacter sp.]